MKIFFILLSAFSLVLGANLNVALSTNSAFIAKEIIASFHQQYPNISIQTTTNSSTQIASNIKNGHLIDIAISDDFVHFDRLGKEGFLQEEQITFAKDNLVIFSFKKSLLGKNIDTLKSSSIRQIALLNPFENIQGKLTIKSLKKAKLYNQVRKKFLYASSPKKLLSYALHVTDVAISSKATLLTPLFQKYQNRLSFITLPETITFRATMVKRYKPHENTKTFLQFLSSEEAKKIISQHGYFL